MSLFGNLFGKPFEALEADGRQLFEQKRYGEAKLSLDKALVKSKGADRDRVAQIQAMIESCKRSLAEGRIAEADRLAATGELEEATALLADAAEIFDHPTIHSAVQERLKRYEVEDTRRLVDTVDEIDDDELMTIIAGTWTDAQADEYAAMPEQLRNALLASHDGRFDEAIEIIEKILNMPDLSTPSKYLYLELGKLYLQVKKPEEAVTLLDEFLERIASDDSADDARLAASNMRAAALIILERFDEAETTLKTCCRLAPENHRVFRELGVFLRSQKKYDESIRVLEKAQELMGQMHPDITVIREIGFTYLAMDRKSEAMTCFKGVIEHFASKGEHTQFDPQTAITLAKLHEEKNEFSAAADLYRHLSVGYDTQNHFVYNLQAARFLKLAGDDEVLVTRYLNRARELAETDEAQRQLAAFEEKSL